MRKYFHTQEDRGVNLQSPIKTTNKNAWLGSGYYFWRELDFARFWGKEAKSKRTGSYQIYSCEIEDVGPEVIDTVFNEEDYYGWVNIIEDTAKKIVEKLKTSRKVTLKELNDFLLESGIFKDIKAIIFQDVPVNESFSLIKGFYYRKRIQIAVYDLSIVSNFKRYE